jgi:rhodanese-related sulfurtransferase
MSDEAPTWPTQAELEISVYDASALLSAEDPGAPILIDVREQDEWDICHLPRATLVPLSALAEKAPRVLADKAQPRIIYCHHGMRSLRATQWLRQQGWTQVWSLTGGIDAWSDQIDPAVPRY